jgi:hypothetical protein
LPGQRDQQDVVAARAEGRELEPHDVDAEVQILAEAADLDRALQITVWRRENAKVDGNLAIAPDGPDPGDTRKSVMYSIAPITGRNARKMASTSVRTSRMARRGSASPGRR